jgi:hypothetical protein
MGRCKGRCNSMGRCKGRCNSIGVRVGVIVWVGEIVK